MFIEIPECMVDLGFVTEEERQTKAYELMRMQYGNVDAARQFFEKYKKIAKRLGLKQSRADPAVWYKRNDAGKLVLMMCCHVDDTLIGGLKREVEQFMNEFEKHLKIDRLGTLRKHLGVWYEWCEDENGDAMLKASMPKMIEEIAETFERSVGRPAKAAPTPGFPGKMLAKYDGEPIRQSDYRSLTGKILYYMTKVGPELANAARDLSSHMDCPGEEHWKALERCVGYLTSLNEEDRALTLRRPKELRSISYADADYAKCEDTRSSISGAICTLGGTLTTWYSRKQATTTLSSAEAELHSYTTCCQEAMFMNMLLEELLGEAPNTAIIYEDNQGCIFLVKNQSVGQRTKHISVRLFFCQRAMGGTEEWSLDSVERNSN